MTGTTTSERDAPDRPERPDRADRPGTTLAEVRAIAALESLDGLRSRRQLVVRTITPIILFACVLAVTVALRGADQRNHPQAYRVAVEGDYAGARATLDRLRPDRLTFFPADDAKLATIEDADTGLRVPDHLDERLRSTDAGSSEGGLVPVEVYQITTNPASSAAAVLIQSAFVDLHTNQVRAELAQVRPDAPAGSGNAKPAPLPTGSFAPLSFNVELTNAGTRTLTSQVIPGLVCLQAALLVAGTANRLVSRRTRGLLMAQLLLPVSRRNLAIAKGLGELVIGFVTATPVVIAILAFCTIVALRDGSAVDLVTHVLATVIAIVALFAFTTAVGVWIGTGARTQEQVSLATGGAVIVAALVATTIALGNGTPNAVLVGIPFAGLIGTLREVLNGTGSVSAFTISVVSTLIGAFAVSALAGRSLDAERMVTRNG